MPTLTVALSDILHATVLDFVPGRYASLDWFVESTLLAKVGAARTEEAAPPRLRATAHRIAGAIVLTSNLHVAVRARDESGQVSADGAFSVHELFVKDTIRTILAVGQTLARQLARTAFIPDLVLKMVKPKQLGQALRRSFAFCDMDP